MRQQFRDQTAEFNAVKVELARLKYCRDENQHLANHLQKQQTDVEEVTKVSPLSLPIGTLSWEFWTNAQVIPEKKRTPPTDGKQEILAGGGN